jgi:hypothetical protein
MKQKRRSGAVFCYLYEMQSLFNPAEKAQLLERLDRITPASVRGWGKMSVSQMMAHCSEALEVACGNKRHSRMFIGRVMSPFFKSGFYSDRPLPKNSPTVPQLVIREEPDFALQKQRLRQLIEAFSAGGPAKVTTYPHSFFGNLTPEQWSKGMFKHMDHHFSQFGV